VEVGVGLSNVRCPCTLLVGEKEDAKVSPKNI